jgi:hypothetical protein
MMILHFFWAMVLYQWAKHRGYEIIAAPWVQDYRTGFCKSCPHFKDGQCQKCGCLVESKVMLNTEQCPLGMWSRRWIKRGK